MDILQYAFFQNALFGILLISITGAIIGTYIVTRRMVFITGGITHASFGGLGIGYYLGINPTLSALAFAILSAFGVEWLSREDSAIAVFWALGMAIGIIFIFLTPGYSPGLSEFLFGNILTITRTDIIIFACYAAVLILFVLLFYRAILYAAFDSDFACTQGIHVTAINACMTFFIAVGVVLSIRLIGIMLLISILSLPQMIAELFCSRYKQMMFLSILISFVCGATGLAVSSIINVPTGASIVCTLVVVYAITKMSYHIATTTQRKRQLRQESEQ